jgi:hypothetical protein
MRANVTPANPASAGVDPPGSKPADVGQPPTPRPLIAMGAAAGVALVAGTGWLWAHYGTTVFFETIRAGFIACFG